MPFDADVSPEQARAALGLAASAGLQEAQAAFRAAAKTVHPDRGGDAEAFQRIVSAWRTIEREYAPPESATRRRRRAFMAAWVG